MIDTLTAPIAARFASLALAHLTREYPNKLTHSLAGPQDVQGPRALHPVFYGSYDWHSCVHGYWLVARLLHRFPDLPEAPRIVAVIDEHFTAEEQMNLTVMINVINGWNRIAVGFDLWYEGGTPARAA